MNTLLADIWPYILTAIITAVGTYVGAIHKLKLKVAVLENTLKNQQDTLINMQKRMDNHSKKQDEILEAISSIKVDIVKTLGDTEKQIAAITVKQEVISSDINIIKNTLSIIEKN